MQLNNIVILIIVFINKVKFIAKSTIIQLCTYFAKKIYIYLDYINLRKTKPLTHLQQTHHPISNDKKQIHVLIVRSTNKKNRENQNNLKF